VSREIASGLAAAAEALEIELRRYEELATSLQGAKLVSEKDLRRAAQALNALRTSDSRLGELVQALVAAIGTARDRQQALADAVRTRAERIRERSETLSALLVRWEALGRDAGEVNRLVQQSAARGEGNGGEKPDAADTVTEVDARLARLAADADELVHAAETAEFVDLARRAESLRAQLESARKQLRRVERKG
jgi:chromosome segregation ATPase